MNIAFGSKAIFRAPLGKKVELQKAVDCMKRDLNFNNIKNKDIPLLVLEDKVRIGLVTGDDSSLYDVIFKRTKGLLIEKQGSIKEQFMQGAPEIDIFG
ncbi:MAG: hypothetical protein PHC34_07325 [Candidatus Gastranaerophilales bacterium]|nr:hypothetical protein [Candidatus Gastranaerophilales bacterium]